jgi:hypothetical protein
MIISKSKDKFQKMDNTFSKNLKISNIKVNTELLLTDFTMEEVADYLTVKLTSDSSHNIVYMSAFFLLPEDMILSKMHFILDVINIDMFHNLLVNTNHINKETVLIKYLELIIYSKNNTSVVFDSISNHFTLIPSFFLVSFPQLKDIYQKKVINKLQNAFIYLYNECCNINIINYNLLNTLLQYIKKDNLNKIQDATLKAILTESTSQSYVKDSFLHSINYKLFETVDNKTQFILKIIDTINDADFDLKNKLLLYNFYNKHILTEEFIGKLDINTITELILMEYSLSKQREMLIRLDNLKIEIPKMKNKIIKKCVATITKYRPIDKIDSNDYEYMFEEIIKYPNEYKEEIKKLINILENEHKDFIFDKLVRLDYQKKEVKGYSDYKFKIIVVFIRFFMKLYTVNVDIQQFIQNVLMVTKNNILINAIAESYIYEEDALELIASTQIKENLNQYQNYKTRIIGLSSFLSIKNNEVLINKLLNINDKLLIDRLNISIMRNMNK